MKPPHSIEVDQLAVFVHGILAGLHLLGVVYNVKRGNVFDVAAHSAAFVYDVYATTKHVRGVNARQYRI